MHTTAYFPFSLIGSDQPTDRRPKLSLLCKFQEDFPEKVNTIIAVSAELTEAM